MKTNFLILIFATIMFISCQRETIIELTPGATDDSGLLVKKIDEATVPGVPGVARATYEYEYNSDKKLMRVNYNSTSESIMRLSKTRYKRDNIGRIVDVAILWERFKNGIPYATLEGPASDTIIGTVAYKDQLSRKIDYVKYVNWSDGKTAVDSTVYEYDANDHVKKTTGYNLPAGVQQPGETFTLYGYTNWTINLANSLVQLETYGKSNAGFTLQIRYTFEHDDKVNPLFRNEDIFINQWFDFSPHNVTKQTVYIAATGETYDNTATYQYRTDNKPSSINSFSPPPVVNANRQSTLYYK
jgi:hypothetical protein